MEVWKDIKGYEGAYQVSNLGNVKSLRREHPVNKCCRDRILKPQTQRGYSRVMLWSGVDSRWESVHRLVAEAFLQNPENKQQVNHIDGNKRNNCVSNLEWVTPSENVRHSFDVLSRKKHTRKVICVETGEVFGSLKEVTQTTGIDYRHIPDCCKGRRERTGGFRWRYAD